MSITPVQRTDILRILEQALLAVDPGQAVRRQLSVEGDRLTIAGQTYHLAQIGRLLVVGAGKAGAPMAAAVQQALGSRVTGGLVNVKYGHLAPSGNWRLRFGQVAVARPSTPGVAQRRPSAQDASSMRRSAQDAPFVRRAVEEAQRGADEHPEQRPEGAAPFGPQSKDAALPPTRPLSPITLIEAGHPVPDAAGLAGAERLATLLSGLTERDLVIVLLSGGGSALLPLPVAGVTLADYRTLTDLLLRSGADITEINTVRKHCSRLQGGRLAQLAAPAHVVSLILSDVVGSPLDAIASGPTVPDPTTFADSWGVLERYGILDQTPPAVVSHLRRGVTGALPDTPKPGDALFARVNNVVIGDNAIAGRAAMTQAQAMGFHSQFLSSYIQGEAREVGRVLAGLAQGIAAGQSDLAAPVCLVLGGETTVTLRGQGRGGRNQELALAAGIALGSHPLPPGITAAVVSFGTDGTDGPTDAAGGLGTADTLSRAAALGLDARAVLAANDSYPCLAALGDLLVTGPTGTNVNDLMLVLCWRE